MSSVTHELRTPLNSSLCMTELALDEKSIPSNLKESLLKPSYFSQKILLNKINDMLDFSRINNQKLSLNYLPTKILNVIKEVYSIMHFSIEKRGIKFNMDLRNFDENTVLNTDEGRLT